MQNHASTTTQKSGYQQLLKASVGVIAGVAVMTLSAKIQIPFWPVPMTLHVLALMALAAALGPRMATAIISGYLVAGATGLPVFSGTPAKGIGIAYMFGPTGGYLLGMLFAAPLVGYLSVSRGIPGKIVAMLLGLAAIYLPGLAWLATFVPVEKILAFGFYPFIAGDLIKVILAACGVHAILSLLNRLRSQGL